MFLHPVLCHWSQNLLSNQMPKSLCELVTNCLGEDETTKKYAKKYVMKMVKCQTELSYCLCKHWQLFAKKMCMMMCVKQYFCIEYVWMWPLNVAWISQWKCVLCMTTHTPLFELNGGVCVISPTLNCKEKNNGQKDYFLSTFQKYLKTQSNNYYYCDNCPLIPPLSMLIILKSNCAMKNKNLEDFRHPKKTFVLHLFNLFWSWIVPKMTPNSILLHSTTPWNPVINYHLWRAQQNKIN